MRIGFKEYLSTGNKLLLRSVTMYNTYVLYFINFLMFVVSESFLKKVCFGLDIDLKMAFDRCYSKVYQIETANKNTKRVN